MCDRPLIPGPSINEHHLIPRRYKGTRTVLMHRICHNKIHAVFSEKELRDWYHTPERLRAHPDIAAFVNWVRRKDPGFMDRHDRRRPGR